MFKKTRTKIRDLKAAFRLLLATIDALTATLNETTNVITIEQSLLRERICMNTIEQSLLRTKLDEIAKHTHFLARAKEQEHARAGHKVA